MYISKQLTVKAKHPGKQTEKQIPTLNLSLLLWQMKANYRYEGINKDTKCTPEHLCRWQGQVFATRFERINTEKEKIWKKNWDFIHHQLIIRCTPDMKQYAYE